MERNDFNAELTVLLKFKWGSHHNLQYEYSRTPKDFDFNNQSNIYKYQEDRKTEKHQDNNRNHGIHDSYQGDNGKVILNEKVIKWRDIPKYYVDIVYKVVNVPEEIELYVTGQYITNWGEGVKLDENNEFIIRKLLNEEYKLISGIEGIGEYKFKRNGKFQTGNNNNDGEYGINFIYHEGGIWNTGRVYPNTLNYSELTWEE